MLRSLVLLIAALPLCADTVAVLPLFNYSKSANLDWIGESVAETVREALGSEGLLVLAREDRMEVLRRLSIRPNAVLTHASVIKIGEALDAGNVIFGQFEFTSAGSMPTLKSTIQLTARLVDLKHTKPGPEFQESGTLEELSLLETKLAWRFVRYLLPNSAPSEADFLRLRPPVRIDAMENYVRGLLAASADQKMKLFQQSARIDENFSQPRFQLGRMHWEKKEFKAAAGWLEKVTRADSHFDEAMFLLALCKYNQYDYTAAVKYLEEVAEEVPLSEVFNNLGAAQSRRDSADSEDNFKKALDGDEADPDYWFNVGYAEWKKGLFFLAADKFRAVLERNAEDEEARDFLSRCQRKEGPHSGDAKSENRERLKYSFEETAFRQLQAELRKK